MKYLVLPFLLALCLVSPESWANAQNCSPPDFGSNSKIYNIFSPEQEMIFGELTYQQMLGDQRFVRDPQLVAYVENIGQNLAKHLPPVGIKFRFFYH